MMKCKRDDGTMVCIKQVQKRRAERHSEIQILSKLSRNAENWPILLGTYRLEMTIGIIYKFIPGSTLFSLLLKNPNLQEEDKLKPCFEMLCATVRACHEAGIWHLDIKPENLVCHMDNIHDVHLIDFGHAIIAPEGSTKKERVCGMGTPGFVSPEVCLKKEAWATSDVWSIGTTLHKCLFSRTAFPVDGRDFCLALQGLKKYESVHFQPLWRGLSSECREFLTSSLRLEPSNRPSIANLSEDVWFSQ